jgi:MYXO-CTERM domain-containing protein
MMDAPLEMTSGEEAIVWIELKNDGNVTRDITQTRAGTQYPQDRDSPFFKEGNWVSASRPSGADHSTYAPGMVGRFTWVMLAPEVDATTRFDETFQLVQEGVTWFGPKTTMSIVVHPRGGPTQPDAGEDPGAGADGDAGVDPGEPGSESGGCSTSADSAPWLAMVLAVTLIRRRRRARS